MSEQQQFDFVKPMWSIGESVTIGDKHGKIIKFRVRTQQVQIEHLDMHSGGEPYLMWYPIRELPPYPVAQGETFDGESDEDVASVPEDTPTPAEFVEPPSVSPPVGQGETSASPPPTPPHDMERGDENEGQEWGDEIYYQAGDTFTSGGGMTIKVVEPSVKGKYMCRVFPANGGSYVIEKSWMELSTYGEPIRGESPPVPEPMTVASDALSSPEPIPVKVVTQGEMPHLPKADTVASDGPLVRREMKIETFTLRDGEGWHEDKASQMLTDFVNGGWVLQSVDYQTIWIPGKSVKESSYVETVVCWVLSRTFNVVEDSVA